MKRAFTFVLLCCVLAPAIEGQGRRPQIRPARRPVPNQYIVTLASGGDAESIGREFEAAHRGRLKHVYRRALRGFAIRLERSAALALAADPRVIRVAEDETIHIADEQFVPPWGLDRIDQRSLPLDGLYSYAPAGTPVHVHVIDTGVRTTHQDFGGRASLAGDFVDDDSDPATPTANDDADPATPDGADCHGHGTHVSGTIAGTEFGVAKHALIHSYRALNCGGTGPESAIIAAIDAITADTRRPAVVNMSIGGDLSPTLNDAVRQSIATGITYVVAAGNETEDASLRSPASVAEAITVGATDAQDARAPFSNFGSILDVFAPGVGVVSAWYTSDTATTSAGVSFCGANACGSRPQPAC